jgi:hypothetical protein
MVIAVALIIIALKKPNAEVIQVPVDNTPAIQQPASVVPKQAVLPTSTLQATYTYKQHGFTMELPTGYIPQEQVSEGGPSISINLPNGSHLTYITNASWWVEKVLPDYTFVETRKIGNTLFNVYTYGPQTIYWYKQGNVAYEFTGDTNLLKTFAFGGWN